MKSFLCLFFVLVAFLCGCAVPDDLAGGVGEETNTVVGVLVAADGNPARNTIVQARHCEKASLNFVDTTDDQGVFGFNIKEQGTYALSANKADQAIYSTFEYTGSKVVLNPKMSKVKSVKGRLVLDGVTSPEGTSISVPGTDWASIANVRGEFALSGLPTGSYNILVSSPEPQRFNSAEFLLTAGEFSYFLDGPNPVGMVHPEEVDVSSVVGGLSYSEWSEITLRQVDVDYKIQYVWTMDSVLVVDLSTELPEKAYYLADSMGHETQTVFMYEPEITEGVKGKAIRFFGSEAAAMDTTGFLDVDTLKELSIEGFIKFNNLDSLRMEGEFQKNVLSKRGNDYFEEVIGISLINKRCGAGAPSLAFYSVNINNPSCGYTAVSSVAMPENEWVYVVFTWKKGVAKIYQNGDLVGQMDTGLRWMEKISKPLYIGGDGLDFELDDVRFGFTEITSAEVRFRYLNLWEDNNDQHEEELY